MAQQGSRADIRGGLPHHLDLPDDFWQFPPGRPGKILIPYILHNISFAILYHDSSLLIQVCLFQVGSFNYDITKMIFHDEFVAESSALK